MALDLADYELKAREATMTFWGHRAAPGEKRMATGNADLTEQAGVTAGARMDGFLTLLVDIVRANGLEQASIFDKRAILTLPGYFCPTRNWDLVVINEGRLIAAVQVKSQVGLAAGDSVNQRTDEAIGAAHDLWAAYRTGAFGELARPFVAWLMMVEDAPRSRAPVRDTSLHFPVLPEFQEASYLKRYEVLCQRLIREQLYTTACTLTSQRSAVTTGEYAELSPMTGLRSFVASLAGHCAAEAAR